MSSSTSDKSTSSSTTTSSASTQDAIFKYDEIAIAKQRAEKPWDHHPKYFKDVKVSALAAMKMLKHAVSGVEAGRKRGSAPIEIMGLLIGKPEGSTIVVMDACPLPVEGSETRVVADDAQVFMFDMLESIEQRRHEKFIGWYHSHPFDVETYSHCHMSAVDVQTQFSWQHSSPTWTAIVIDPLRSLARQEPEMGAYRVYPAKHNVPTNECPDGTTLDDPSAMIQRWGLSYHRYYSLPISYFMSSLGNQLVDVMSKNNLWVRVLSTAPVLDTENRERFSDRINRASEKLAQSTGDSSLSSLRSNKKKSNKEDLHVGAQACSELAIEQCKGHCSQVVKDLLFNYLQRRSDNEEKEEPSAKAASSLAKSSSATMSD